MAAKVFEVGDVLPAGQIKITLITITTRNGYILSDNNNLVIIEWDFGGLSYAKILGKYYDYVYGEVSYNYYTIDTSNWSLAERTISYSNAIDEVFWELVPSGYTITFNSNGGTTIPDIEEATELPDPLPIPTKSGYTFVNWYYDSAFTQKANAGDTLESNVTLYAKWELNTYTITYNSNGGSSISQTSDVTQLPSELPIPTKAHSTFVGWYYDSTLKQKAKPNDMINTNVTLYAKWYDSLSAFYTDIANLIREFENSGDNIKVTDFADRLRALLESV